MKIHEYENLDLPIPVIVQCQAQTQSCPEIYGGRTGTNVCYPYLLTNYCASTDGTSPGRTRFIQTLPFFFCEATYQQCVNGADSGIEA